MRKGTVLIIVIIVLLVGIEPLLHGTRMPHPPPVIRLLEIIALPFRLAWLSAQPADEVLVMPVVGAKVKHITDTWGAPRAGGRGHQGQDIFAPRGTEVRAATAGYVVRRGRNALGGNSVVIAGAGGRRYYYAHLDGFAADLRVGQRVTVETILGSVGQTGNAVHTPPHLHFGMFTRGGATNPLPLLRDRLASSP